MTPSGASVHPRMGVRVSSARVCLMALLFLCHAAFRFQKQRNQGQGSSDQWPVISKRVISNQVISRNQ